MVVTVLPEVRLLGAVEVLIGGDPVDIGHSRQQCVLAALVIEANHIAHTDRLIDRVWGDHPPQHPRGALHSYLSRLRQLLAATDGVRITRHPDGYQLSVDTMAVDLFRFRHLVTTARATRDDEAAIALFEQALGLWRGQALGTLDTPWLNAIREGLDAERLAVELDRNDVALRLGRHAELLSELTAATLAYPWDERIAGQAMLALYRSGRQADALEAYQRMRLRLAEELGADPSPPLQALHQQVLRADPAIAAPSAVVERPAPRHPHTPVPRQLPASSPSFTGRASELAELDAIMDVQPAEGATIAAISGGGGMGKTWLALRWANTHAARYPDGQLYVNLRGFDPTSPPVDPAAAVRGFLVALGVDAARIPADPDAQTALYRSLVADRRVLIVLDNARDSATVVPLLPGTTAGAVLVTSRRQLTSLVVTHGARTLTLDLMSEADARELLARQFGLDLAPADADAVGVLLAQCAGLPLALGIAAARAALQPEVTLAGLAADLQAAATRLDAFDAGELAVNLRAVLSCSTGALTGPAAQMFELLGLANGPDVSLAAAASLGSLPTAATRALLGQLAAAHLVQEYVTGRYRMHDLVRLYARERAVAHGSAADEALARLLDYYLHTAHAAALLLSPHREPLRLAPPLPGVAVTGMADLNAAMEWFTSEHPVLLATIRHAGDAGLDRHANQLPWTLATYFDRQGHWHDWVQAQQVAVGAAVRLGDWPAEAQARRLLANAHSNLRAYDDAYDQLRQTLELFDAHEDDAGRAHAHFDIALLFDRQGRPADALPHALRSLTCYRAVANQLGEAVALNAVGWYHCELGEYRESIGYCRQALTLTTEVGSAYGQANTWDSLGYAHHHLDEHPDAIECYRQAIALFRDIGDRHAEALVLDHLGDTHDAAGDPAAARAVWQEALDILDAVGHPDTDELRVKLGLARHPATVTP